MFQKLLVGLLTVVLSVITPMVVLDHQRVATELQTLKDSSLLSYLEITALKTKTEFSLIRGATRNLVVPNLGNGSGVMIAPGRMLTAAHVASIDNEDTPLTLNGKRVKILKIDETLDLALLQVEEDCPCVPVGKDLPKPDTVAYVVGFPVYREGMPQYLTEGKIQGYWEETNRILTNILTAPGNSGGGLFIYNDGQWELSGIVVSVSAIGSLFSVIPVYHVSHSVDTKSIRKFLENE